MSAPRLRRLRTLLSLRAIARDPEMVTTHALIYDLDGIKLSIDALKAAFPSHFMHTFAVKAATPLPVLRYIVECGMGLETASVGELKLATRVCDPSRIVFDCPAKTVEDLTFALERGIFTNLDNFTELATTERLVAANPHWPTPRVGLRINPQSGVGDALFAGYATVSASSKFGIPLLSPDNKDAIVSAFVRLPWLCGLHCHAGSQGVPLGLTASAQHALVALARDIVAAGGRVDTLDIGGGLSVNFGGDYAALPPVGALADAPFADTPTFSDAVATLRESVPALFAGAPVEGGEWTPTRVVTEYGRTIVAKHGTLVSRVIATKYVGASRDALVAATTATTTAATAATDAATAPIDGVQVVLQHIGGDLMARTTFLPDAWKFRTVAADASGRVPLAGPFVPTAVAGACCNSADVIAPRARLLRADVAEGDLVAVLDAGSYSYSSYMMYNVRAMPAILGVSGLQTAAVSLLAAGAGADADAVAEDVALVDGAGADVFEDVAVRTMLPRRTEDDIVRLLSDE